MMQSQIILFGNVETVRYDLSHVLLLQSIVTSISVVAGQQQSHNLVAEICRSIGFEEQCDELLSVIGFFDSPHVGEPV